MLTLALALRIAQAIEAGVARGVVCERLGIDATTLWRWLRRGAREGEAGLYRTLYEAVTAAEGAVAARACWAERRLEELACR